jgi:hypothetical protein
MISKMTLTETGPYSIYALRNRNLVSAALSYGDAGKTGTVYQTHRANGSTVETLVLNVERDGVKIAFQTMEDTPEQSGLYAGIVAGRWEGEMPGTLNGVMRLYSGECIDCHGAHVPATLNRERDGWLLSY